MERSTKKNKYSFGRNKQLRSYVEKRIGCRPGYTMKELFDTIIQDIEEQDMFSKGNRDIIILANELKQALQINVIPTWAIKTKLAEKLELDGLSVYRKYETRQDFKRIILEPTTQGNNSCTVTAREAVEMTNKYISSRQLADPKTGIIVTKNDPLGLIFGMDAFTAGQIPQLVMHHLKINSSQAHLYDFNVLRKAYEFPELTWQSMDCKTKTNLAISDHEAQNSNKRKRKHS